MKSITKEDNVFSIPELRDFEKEFTGLNSFSQILYNNFFSHPFAENRLTEYANQMAFKFKLIKNAFGLIEFDEQVLFN